MKHSCVPHLTNTKKGVNFKDRLSLKRRVAFLTLYHITSGTYQYNITARINI